MSPLRTRRTSLNLPLPRLMRFGRGGAAGGAAVEAGEGVAGDGDGDGEGGWGLLESRTNE